jgi:hypothetical protein
LLIVSSLAVCGRWLENANNSTINLDNTVIKVRSSDGAIQGILTIN